MKRLVLLAAAVAAPAFSAHAGPASDAVRFFYAPNVVVDDPENRDRFVDPARALFGQNDTLSKDGEIGCIDFALQYDAQDLDDAEVARTLKLQEKVSGGTATVTATFRLFPGEAASKRSILWTLKQVGGSWKVSDMAGNDWALSKIDCSESGGAE